MDSEERPLRADAERNRKRLLDAATQLFRERGLEVGVGEIAERAHVGRGTLFRNFPTKEDLIAAVVVERMSELVARGRELIAAPDAGEAVFEYLGEVVGRQQLDRSLAEAVADELLANPGIRSAHAELVGVLDTLLKRAQAEHKIRPDVGALDVLMLTKGVCQAVSAFAHIDPEIGNRQLDLVRSALTAPADAPLRGRAATLEDLDRAIAPGATRPERAAAQG
ncbi:MAG TPA: helix-turn-helix domain-containing protein [Solirubrobacteraceae bacterium]|jgi:AcrR family transcriptional regulator